MLERLGILEKPARILHFAPEQGIYEHFRNAERHTYVPCDVSPARYAKDVLKIDLCNGLAEFGDGSFDLVMHNHVLEHVPCNYTYVLRAFDRVLSIGGVHLFSVPIRDGYYSESLDPEMTGAQRKKLFGQDDHMRYFGSKDLHMTLGRVYDLPPEYDAAAAGGDSDLIEANVPPHCWRGYSAHSILCLRKTSEGMVFELPPPRR